MKVTLRGGISVDDEHGMHPIGKRLVDRIHVKWIDTELYAFADLLAMGLGDSGTLIGTVLRGGEDGALKGLMYGALVYDNVGLYWGNDKVDFRIVFHTGPRYPHNGDKTHSTLRYYANEEIEQAVKDIFSVLSTGDLEKISKPFHL